MGEVLSQVKSSQRKPTTASAEKNLEEGESANGGVDKMDPEFRGLGSSLAGDWRRLTSSPWALVSEKRVVGRTDVKMSIQVVTFSGSKTVTHGQDLTSSCF